MTQRLSPKKVGLLAGQQLTPCPARHSSPLTARADEENANGNVSPAPAFQTQAVSLACLAKLLHCCVYLYCFW